MKILLLTACCLILQESLADTRSIHVIKILDTQYPSTELNRSIKLFETGINREANLIKTKLGLTNLIYHRITDKNFKNLEKIIDTISIDIDDIVLVLYAGHGIMGVIKKTYINRHGLAV